MARRGGNRGGNRGRNPKGGDQRDRGFGPKNPKEQTDAIAGDIKNEIIAFVLREHLDGFKLEGIVNRALGRGGEKLEEFLKEHITGYAKSVRNDNETAQAIAKDKEQAPYIKQVSKDVGLDLGLDDPALNAATKGGKGGRSPGGKK